MSNREKDEITFPKLSIIIPTRNSEAYLAKALSSIESQKNGVWECLLIDGNSTDETLKVARNYSWLNIKQQSGLGLYPAINEALSECRGEIVGFLNSDDYYADSIFDYVIDSFNNASIEILSGKASVFSEKDFRKRLHTYKTIVGENGKLKLEEILYGVPAINALFFRKNLITSVGGFDENLSLSSDRELLIRFSLLNCNCCSLDTQFYYYREHDKSLTLGNNYVNRSKIGQEHMHIAQNYSYAGLDKPVFRDWYYSSMLTMIYGLIRTGAYREALSSVLNEWKKNSLLPLYFCRALTTKLARKLF